MKVLLACTSIEETYRPQSIKDSNYPLGLAYLHAHIEKYHPQHQVKTHFLNNVALDECVDTIKNEINSFKPDVLGLSIMTHSRVSAFKVIEWVQENHPDIKIVLGGIHPTILWHQIVKKYPEVIVVIGEGELTFGDLLDHLELGKPINNVGGIAHFDGEKVVATKPRPLIEDLDILPIPKHELFLYEGRVVANILTSRGCPFKCNFCVLDNVSLRTVRFRTAENICDEIEKILELCPTVENIWLHDDAFMINKKRTEALCNEILRRGIKTTFTCSARYRPVSKSLIHLMEKAGFNHVLFGLEFGADAVTAGMRKGVNKDHIRYATSLLAERKIKTTAFLIVGLPNETEETVNQTIDFVQELQYNNYLYYDDIAICGIYPGAEVYTIAKQKKLEIEGYGVLDDDYWLTDGNVPEYTCEHSIEKLHEWKDKIRNAVSMSRLETVEGFMQQRKILGSIIRYAFRFPGTITGMIPLVKSIIENDKVLLQEFVAANMQPLFGGEPAHLLDIVTQELERRMIRDIKWTPEEQKTFVQRYREQLKVDKETVERWNRQKVPATDEYVLPSKREAIRIGK